MVNFFKGCRDENKTPMSIRSGEIEVFFDRDKCSFRRVVEQKPDWTRSMRGE